MTEELEEFTTQLGYRGHVSLLERTSGTVLVELEDDGRTERWYVNVQRGDVSLEESAQGRVGPRLRVTDQGIDFQGDSHRTTQPAGGDTARPAHHRGQDSPGGRAAGPVRSVQGRCRRGCRRLCKGARMSADVKILDGNTFVVSDSSGDIEASMTDPTGLFSFDTRFLSKWVLTIDGQQLNPLSVDDLQYFETRFFLVPGTGTVYVDAKLSVIRQRAVGGGFHEELTILNHDDEAGRPRSPYRGGQRLRRPLRGQGRPEEAGRVLPARRRRPPGARLPARDLRTRDVDLGDRPGLSRRRGPHASRCTSNRTASWTTDLRASPPEACRGQPTQPAEVRPRQPRRRSPTWRRASRSGSTTRRAWSATGTRSSAPTERSLVDLAALRFSPPILPGHSLPAAGLPWFMTMFGRDSIFTSLQALPFNSELAASTLHGAGHLAGHAQSTTSATRTPAASCTRCATAS